MAGNQQQKNRPRLGRGLSSLLNVSELPVEAEIPAPPSVTDSAESTTAPSDAPVTIVQPGPIELPLAEVTPNPHQPRRTFDEAGLRDLAASLKSNGVIQPIIVRKVESGYQLIAGERRWRASQLAGLKTVPAIIREVDSFTQAQMALVENIQRTDLNPIERAGAYRELMTQLGLTQSELATRLGEERSSIANYLRLLDLCEAVRTFVKDGQISFGHAKLLAGVASPTEQERLAKLCVTQELSVRNLERLISSPDEPVAPKQPKAGSAHLMDLEKSISRQLGMRVQVRSAGKGNKGRLVVHYASLDQFDELMGRLGVKTE